MIKKRNNLKQNIVNFNNIIFLIVVNSKSKTHQRTKNTIYYIFKKLLFVSRLKCFERTLWFYAWKTLFLIELCLFYHLLSVLVCLLLFFSNYRLMFFNLFIFFLINIFNSTLKTSHLSTELQIDPEINYRPQTFQDNFPFSKAINTRSQCLPIVSTPPPLGQTFWVVVHKSNFVPYWQLWHSHQGFSVPTSEGKSKPWKVFVKGF